MRDFGGTGGDEKRMVQLRRKGIVEGEVLGPGEIRDEGRVKKN